ncbi:MAG: sulfoxide reductase heme-binding subunit YedZ [Methylocystis sp.]|nr:sulfoxide reductase heme-binding subunit YedZ [Methylocystis sp.]MCA3583097.1 sulfoxide reductase heme-binding subunit YedZ [Methylocystis sp.]MCA3588398.1 sulfoxide reductase heme-binding subunit YedZ [Methylocystis sp.]MCA3593246.1 sulfoxide reductase heme-binding subunit YedZ [Methylocystis sp.]
MPVTPWTTRSGALSPLKLITFTALWLPAGWLALQAAAGWLGSKPLTEAIHQSGDWAVRLLLISLAVTPLRFIGAWPDLILVRRMLGLAALAYTALHVALYVALEAFDLGKVASEIALRIYLTIGFVALLGLAVLGATSTDGMIRRLGSVRWNRLHSIVYAIAVLALVHFALQRKIDISEVTLMTGFFLWLMGFRLLKRYGRHRSLAALLALAVAAGLMAAFAEFAWYALMTGVPAGRVLAANLDFTYTIRPAWWVLAAGLGMAGLAFLRTRAFPERRRSFTRDGLVEPAGETP